VKISRSWQPVSRRRASRSRLSALSAFELGLNREHVRKIHLYLSHMQKNTVQPFAILNLDAGDSDVNCCCLR
jgi:hypothetical protein